MLQPFAAAQSATTSESDFVNVEFSGSVKAHFDQQVEYLAGHKDTITSDLFYSWRESTVEPITAVTTPVIGETKDLVTGAGTITVTNTLKGALSNAPCEGQVQEFAQTSGRFATSDSGVRVLRVQGAGAPGIDGVEVSATTPTDYYQVTNNCHGYVEHAMESYPETPLTCTVSPNKSCGKGYQKSGSFPIADGHYTYSVIASLQVIRSTKAEPPTPQKNEAKDAAAQDFSNLLFGKTLEFCYPRMIDISEGPAYISGSVTVTFDGAPWVEAMCSALLNRMQDDWFAFHDPPRRDYLDLATGRTARTERARPQSCRQAKASDRALCLRVASAGAKLLAAEQQVGALAAAIRTTVGREAGAQRAGNRSAIALQERQLGKLATQFSHAQLSAKKAGAELANLLLALHVSGRIPQALYDHAVAVVRKGLAHRGITQSDIAKIVPPGTSPPPDFLVVLGAPPASTVTPPPSPAPPASPTIASVTFSGSSANPSFVVHGTDLGTQPKPDPPVHPLGTSGCPITIPGGDDGYDYGTSLYIAVPAKNWAGGRYRPSLNETDCIDLVVTKFTPTEVDFHFGRSYASFYPKFSLNDGDTVEVGVNGAARTVHVKYGATVSS